MSVDTTLLTRYNYDPRARRYRDSATGTYVPAKTVRNAVDSVIARETVTLRQLSLGLQSGTMSLPDWQARMGHEVKVLHVAMGLAANGGVHNSSPADLGYLGSQIKEQYKLLANFAVQIKRGEQKLDGTLLSRTGLYAQSSRGTYEDMGRRVAGNGGATQERRVLGLADSCNGCLEAAALGWQPIGSLPAIGETECRGNCHCSFETK